MLNQVKRATYADIIRSGAYVFGKATMEVCVLVFCFAFAWNTYKDVLLTTSLPVMSPCSTKKAVEGRQHVLRLPNWVEKGVGRKVRADELSASRYSSDQFPLLQHDSFFATLLKVRTWEPYH